MCYLVQKAPTFLNFSVNVHFVTPKSHLTFVAYYYLLIFSPFKMMPKNKIDIIENLQFMMWV